MKILKQKKPLRNQSQGLFNTNQKIYNMEKGDSAPSSIRNVCLFENKLYQV